ncbi:MAG: protein-glutamate O-methyltransferase CheR [Treponema sp.]|nr:protein-glutamate O-methyltransferase CheR [Treponema sp.]
MMQTAATATAKVSQSAFLYPTAEILSKAQFYRIASYMEQVTGIKLPESKLTMVQSRLNNRLKVLRLKNFEEYTDFVFSGSAKAEEEVINMIDLLTTNLTHFFRESQHFDFMTQQVLPQLVKEGVQRPEIWSAGCSSGEEPYTLSIVMKEFIEKNPGSFFDYSILATDISTRILDKAIKAVYPMDTVEKLPLSIKKKYFLKGKDSLAGQVRVKSDVRSHIHFDRLNFMNPSFSVGSKKNIIFCRNVLIYFDKPTQAAVIRKLVDCLLPDGYLFLGHSETIFGMDLPLKTVSSTVFRKIKG